jgi:hypothetical protein
MQGDQYIRSNMPASEDDEQKQNPTNYGQQGYTGSSSTYTDKPVSSNFLPEQRGDLDKADAVFNANKPGRASDAPIAPAFGMKGASAGAKVPANNRPVTTSAPTAKGAVAAGPGKQV